MTTATPLADAPATYEPGSSTTDANSIKTRPATLRMLGAELRLLLRDPVTTTFVVAFPIIAMLIIGGVFGTQPNEVFPVNPSHWYVASYFTTVIGATGLIMLPVHIASYRERGVLRRFAAAGFPRWSFALAQLVVGLITVAVAGALLLAVAAPVYGIPEVDDLGRVILAATLGAIAFIAIGVLLGTVLPTARSAQAVGLLLFFPSFLLGVGGPPPAVMGDALGTISEWLPLGLVTQAVREPWLGIGSANTALVVTAVLAIVGVLLAGRRTAL
ncbi:ABC transporter permease [Cumulibacter soli]|uniref:ABC transporter permease n=1 Tax=Cumulibacter soli TaxID=2546344 RepID=UPI00106822F2|nr:ABC transporter permease [Cumulibacter soli]